MEIINQFPPNVAEIAKKFPIDKFTPVFTYGDKLYNPTGLPISDDLMAHEETHAKQQAQMGVDNWWGLYLADEGFRTTQEAEAYREQYRYAKDNYPREYRRRLLDELSSNFASSLYGSIINKKKAKELING